MWSELTYLVEKRCKDAKSPPAARAIVALYGALCNCEIAFERVESGETDLDRADAVLAMDTLLAVLHNLQSSLNLLDPEPAAALDDYLADRSAAFTAENAKARLKRQVELLRRLLVMEERENHLEIPTRTAFTGARQALAAFILATYSPEELFASQVADG